THFTRDARHFGGEGIQLVHHRIDGVFQLQNFAFDVDRDLARQIASSNGGRHFGDVAHLPGQVAGHGVYRVGEIFPRTGNARHIGLTTEPPFRTDFAGDARDFAGERVELVHHRINGV